MTLGKFFKTIGTGAKVALFGTLSGAAAGALDAAMQGGVTNVEDLKRVAISGAVMGAVGYWLKSPRQPAQPEPPVQPGAPK